MSSKTHPRNAKWQKKPKIDKENYASQLKSPVRTLHNFCGSTFRSPLRNIGHVINSIAVTPPHSRRRIVAEPPTPTANFKLLSSVAASLDYLDNDSSSTSTEFGAADENLCISTPVPKAADRPSSRNRKERSLSFICDRFLLSYPPYPDDDTEIYISVDTAATNLGVERRRMYDIVNVLECIEVVKKMGKNSYRYFGKRKLLGALKSLSIKAKTAYFPDSSVSGENAPLNLSSNHLEDCRKEKTLGVISRKFLMMFLASEEAASISLQRAAEVLLGESKCAKDSVQFKTKIRRLYDIANIFVSVRLIEKDTKVGKQCYKYVGPSLIYLQQIDADRNIKGDEFVLQYLFPVAKPENVTETAASEHVVVSQRAIFTRTRSENWDSEDQNGTKPCKSFVRHSSFHDICTAAEVARKKLYDSQKCSRLGGVRLLLPKPLASGPDQVTENKRLSNLIHLNVPIYNSKLLATVTPQTPCKKVPTQTIVNALANQHELKDFKSQFPNNPVIMKLQNTDEASNSQKVINLTGEQRSNILKFLNVSLEEGQVATILISNNEKQHSAAMSQLPSAVIKEDTNSHTRIHNQDSLHNAATSNSLSSCGNELNNLAIDSPILASPFSIPSGYTTPSVSNISNPTFLPNKEVTDVLSNIENKFPLLSKSLAYRNMDENASSDLSLSVFKDNSNSNDSVNKEVQAFTNGDKTYLFDEKTMSSPIKCAVGETVHSIAMPLFRNYFKPITIPCSDNYLVLPIKTSDDTGQKILVTTTRLPEDSPKGVRSNFKQPRKIIARRLIMMNNQCKQ